MADSLPQPTSGARPPPFMFTAGPDQGRGLTPGPAAGQFDIYDVSSDRHSISTKNLTTTVVSSPPELPQVFRRRCAIQRIGPCGMRLDQYLLTTPMAPGSDPIYNCPTNNESKVRAAISTIQETTPVRAIAPYTTKSGLPNPVHETTGRNGFR